MLLIMNNHETHISISVINFAKDNGIVLLRMPTHTSHRLQPLDWTGHCLAKRFRELSPSEILTKGLAFSTKMYLEMTNSYPLT